MERRRSRGKESRMNGVQRVAWAVLVVFSSFTAWVLWKVGFRGIWQTLLGGPAGWQVLADLVIALTIVLSWLRMDAQRNGRAFAPWLVLTLVLGSIGPLLYLALGRSGRARDARV
jgi:hypothetical protein